MHLKDLIPPLALFIVTLISFPISSPLGQNDGRNEITLSTLVGGSLIYCDPDFC